MKPGGPLAGFKLAVAAVYLASLDIAAVLAAFGLYRAVRPSNQIAFQAPVACVLVALGCVLGQKAVERFRPGWAPDWTTARWLGAQAGALLAGPALLVPLHFATQGYLTSWGNVIGLWLFQLPANALALALATAVAGRGPLTRNAT